MVLVGAVSYCQVYRDPEKAAGQTPLASAACVGRDSVERQTVIQLGRESAERKAVTQFGTYYAR